MGFLKWVSGPKMVIKWVSGPKMVILTDGSTLMAFGPVRIIVKGLVD